MIQRVPPFICTIGDLMLDVVVLPDAPLTPDGDTPARIRLSAGGQAANVAAWAAALGARSRLICARGTDQAAELAAAQLQSLGVELCGPVVEGAGGVVVSTREPDGVRTMASDPGASARLDAGALDPAWLDGVDVLHVSGYCLLRETAAPAAIAAAALAPRVTLDLASAADIERFGPERLIELVRALDPELVFANEAERASLDGRGAGREAGREAGQEADREAGLVAGLDRALGRPVGWVVKLGARGAAFPEGHLAAAAARVLDTTGAGDALAAGYLVGGPSLAVRAAALCVERVGAMPGLYIGP